MKVKFVLVKKSDDRLSFNVKVTAKGRKAFKVYSTPFGTDQWDYKKQQLNGVSPRSKEEFKEYTKNRNWISETVKPYQDLIDKLIGANKQVLPAELIKRLEDGNPQKTAKTVFELWERRIEELKSNEKYGTAGNYKHSLKKFKDFRKNEDLLFAQLDATEILKFRQSMKGLSNSSISMHLRNLRAVYNLGIELGAALQNDYPFKKNKSIMKELPVAHTGRALTKDSVDSIRQYKEKLNKGSELWHACNYFIFGYVGRGINFQDMARLKWDGVKDGRVEFVRFKTRSKVQDMSSFAINEELAEILSWYRRNNTQLHNPFVFPVLNASHKSEYQKFNRIKKVRKMVNASLVEIGQELELTVKLTTYVWRHTFASVMKNKLNAPLSMISEMLGHKSLSTTEAYLAQFPDVDKDKAVIGL